MEGEAYRNKSNLLLKTSAAFLSLSVLTAGCSWAGEIFNAKPNCVALGRTYRDQEKAFVPIREGWGVEITCPPYGDSQQEKERSAKEQLENSARDYDKNAVLNNYPSDKAIIIRETLPSKALVNCYK